LGVVVRIRLSAASLMLLFVVATHAQTPAPAAAAANATPPTTFVVKFRVKAGKNAEFEKIFKEAQKGVHDNEPGNVYYDFFVDQKDPQLYVIVERYKDAAAIAAHGQGEHTKKMSAAIRELLDGPVDAQRLVLISAK
jgi:quinol monooxygenase YgiN